MRETECSHYEPADGDCLTNACGGGCVKYRAELEALRAENERLRTAVEIEREGQRSMARALSEINRLSRLDVAVHLVPSAENERLRAAATEALAVLTRLADSAVYWSEYDVPVGIVAEIDEAKARLAGALSREARP